MEQLAVGLVADRPRPAGDRGLAVRRRDHVEADVRALLGRLLERAEARRGILGREPARLGVEAVEPGHSSRACQVRPDRAEERNMPARTLAVAATALGALILPSAALAGRGDRNHDRIPDRWERHYGIALTKKAATGDPDRDGLTNLGEFVAQEPAQPFQGTQVPDLGCSLAHAQHRGRFLGR